MKSYVSGNKMVSEGTFSENVFYDVGNRKINFETNGKGEVSRFERCGYYDVFTPNTFYGNVTINGFFADVTSAKTNVMYGKRQDTFYKIGETDVGISIFTDEFSDRVFYEISALGKIEVNFGFEAKSGAFVYTDGKLYLRERLDDYYHYTVCGNDKIIIVFCATEMNGGLNEAYLSAKNGESNYWSKISELSDRTDSPCEYASLLNCAVSSYKEIEKDGTHFSAFFAGINYTFPARTYFRDGYYTALPTLIWDSDFTKNQILTSALGIDANYSCGSAVDLSGNQWWKNHIDSPLYFCLLTEAYINYTANREILSIKVNGKTIKEYVVGIADKYIDLSDETAMIVREEYNRLDWCDNVYRCGYVTYIQGLYYGVLRFVFNLTKDNKYDIAAKRLKTSVKERLYLSDKGYYANYLSDNFIEDNLSIDTVTLILFGLLDKEEGRKLLTKMEAILESRNNKDSPFGDYGVMCVYPCYKYKAHLVEKSSYNYVYHNGAEWVYLSAAYSMAKYICGMDYAYPQRRWFDISLENGWFTPIEYYSKICKGSYLQGWSGLMSLTFTPCEMNKIFKGEK